METDRLLSKSGRKNSSQSISTGLDAISDQEKSQGLSLVLITLVAFLTSAAYRIHSPLMSQYTYQVFTQEVYGNESRNIQVSRNPCINDSDNSTSDSRAIQVQSMSADFLSRLSLASGGIGIIVNIFLGAYSDSCGRKLVLLLPIFGKFVRNATAPVIIYWQMDIRVMYIGYVFDGLCGSVAGAHLGLYVYTSDITKANTQRTLGMAVVQTGAELGMAALCVVSGVFIEETGYFYPALTASVLQLLCFLIIAFLLPETIPPDRKRPFSPTATVKHLIGTFRSPDSPSRQAMLIIGLLSFLLATLPFINFSSLINLYLMNEPFCWDAIRIGIFGTVWNGTGLVASLTLIKLLQKVLSTPLLVIVGALSEAGEVVMLAMAKDNLTAYMVPVLGIVKKTMFPAMRSYMSQLVPPDRQGALFAGMAILESVCCCLGLFVFINIYKATLAFMAGFVFLVIAGLHILVIILFSGAVRLGKHDRKQREIVVNIQSECQNCIQHSVQQTD